MIHLLSLADQLRCSSKLYDVIMCACECVLPPNVFKQVKEGVDSSSLRLPDKGQISRARLYIDVAIMLWQRILNSPGPGTEDCGFVRYLSWDSSPQFERDYELCLVQSCRRADLRKVFEASRDLMSMWNLQRPAGVGQGIVPDGPEIAKKEAFCMEFIRERVITHALPSVLVGCRRAAKNSSVLRFFLDIVCVSVETIRFGASTFAHKLKSLAHALRLETFTHDSLAAFSHDLVSVVSDYGVERLLCKLAPISVQDLCPWFSDTPDSDIAAVRGEVHQLGFGRQGVPDRAAFEDPEAEAAPSVDEDDPAIFEAPEPEHMLADVAGDHSDSNAFEDVPPAPTFDPSGALDAPALHHFVDNMTKSLSSVMGNYDCIDAAVVVCRLLRRRSPREKLLQRCFQGPVGHAFRKDIQQFRGHIHKGRWGTVMFSVPELLKVERVLRWAWDKDVFMGRAGAEGADNEDTNLAAEADKAISSPFWWGWLHMLEHVCKVVRRAISWIEGCPCHSELLHGDVSDLPPELVRQWQSCPMRGLRAAEISAGDFAEVLATVTGASNHLVFLFSFLLSCSSLVSSFRVLFSFCLLFFFVVFILFEKALLPPNCSSDFPVTCPRQIEPPLWTSSQQRLGIWHSTRC